MAVDLTKIGRFIDLVEKHLEGSTADESSLSVRVAALENKVSASDAAVIDVSTLGERVTALESENADLKSKVAELEAFVNALDSAIDSPVTDQPSA